jgi:murein DD-endopeptidase MepM/ murein hydrolase activator NlpD
MRDWEELLDNARNRAVDEFSLAQEVLPFGAESSEKADQTPTQPAEEAEIVALVAAEPDSEKTVLPRVRNWRESYDEWRLGVEHRLAGYDLAPDLAENIGSRKWFRGLGTMLGLGALALAAWPDLAPLEARPPITFDQTVRDEFRSQMITPLALGADSGRRSSATDQVIPLARAPERPQIDLVATLASGDSFRSTLRRAGLSATDINQVANLVSGAMPLNEILPGTQVDITLGRRSEPGVPRPLTDLTFRARFDLELAITRDGDNLGLSRNAIRVDETPLRLRGRVGGSLYRSMRAAGAPASAVQAYLRALDNQISVDREVRASDEFDMIISYRRAATGERQAGQLMFAGLSRGGESKAQLMRWGSDGQFYEASGVGEQRHGLVAPVPGPISSRFGMRRHPILGYRRMHAGMDFRAAHGTPIVAVTDGRVTSAGRAGGCGLAVKLSHSGGMDTRYCHMSRMAVSRGQRVKRGQVIGYVGSTGLSTGPHLHYEVYRNGKAINPASVKFVTRAQLKGRELEQFRETLRKLKTVEPGAALQDLKPLGSEVEAPKREIEKVQTTQEVG